MAGDPRKELVARIAIMRQSVDPALLEKLEPIVKGLPRGAIAQVRIGGVTVNPGDLIYGDRDGVLVVPQEDTPVLAAV